MNKPLFAIILAMALGLQAIAQKEGRGHHQGETFELGERLPADEDHTYTASNYIKLMPGFSFKPEVELSALFNLGLDPLGIHSPETGHTNENGYVVGTMGGAVNIGAMGGLNYTIPIEVPVGINGMQPTVSVGYNNQAGNGLLGWGWDLLASSCITRTGQTLYHDGKMTGIELTTKDRFLLDGQRLILVNGHYGVGGSEYKTENDGMSKIRMLESSGIKYFKVWERSGNILEYRERLCSPDMEKEILWMLSKVTDRYGNAIGYHYANSHMWAISLGETTCRCLHC